MGGAWRFFGNLIWTPVALENCKKYGIFKVERKSLTAFTNFGKVKTINSPFLFYKDGLLTPEGCLFNPLLHFRGTCGRD